MISLWPSAAERWLTCTASQPIIAAMPQVRDSTVYSTEGDLAHALLNQMLLTTQRGKSHLIQSSLPPLYRIGVEHEVSGFQHTISREMTEHVGDCVDYVLERGAGVMLTEVRGEWIAVEGQARSSGPLDVLLQPDGSTDLHIFDLKYGRGVEVRAEGNPQLRLYGLGALADELLFEDIETVHLHVMQPRRHHFDCETLTVEELYAWASTVVIPAAENIVHDRGVFAPSEDACRWCPLKADCTAVADELLDEFDVLDSIDTETKPELVAQGMTLVQLDDYSRRLDWVASVASAMRDRVQRLLHTGEKFEHWKLVAGRKPGRKWKGEDETIADAIDSVGVVPYQDPKLKSPAMVEQELGRTAFREGGVFADLVEQGEATPVLAHSTDPRPEWEPATPEDFDK